MYTIMSDIHIYKYTYLHFPLKSFLPSFFLLNSVRLLLKCSTEVIRAVSFASFPILEKKRSFPIKYDVISKFFIAVLHQGEEASFHP